MYDAYPFCEICNKDGDAFIVGIDENNAIVFKDSIGYVSLRLNLTYEQASDLRDVLDKLIGELNK